MSHVDSKIFMPRAQYSYIDLQYTTAAVIATVIAYQINAITLAASAINT